MAEVEPFPEDQHEFFSSNMVLGPHKARNNCQELKRIREVSWQPVISISLILVLKIILLFTYGPQRFVHC